MCNPSSPSNLSCLNQRTAKIQVKNWRQKVMPYVLIAPNSIIFLLFVLIPVIYGFYYSFMSWKGIGDGVFIGLANYAEAFSDLKFWNSMKNTGIFVIFSLPFIMAVPLFLANLMIKNLRGRSVFRAIFYWPTMLSFIVVGISFKFIFGDTTGVINFLLEKIHIAEIGWLTTSVSAMFVVILATIWCRSGFYMIMYMSGLQNISTTYYEASEIDGANKYQQFFYITLPLLKPTTFLVMILGLIDLFKTYGLVIALTNGGPAGATKFIVQYIYEKAFSELDLGYACSLSILLMLILAVLTLLQFITRRGGEIDA